MVVPLLFVGISLAQDKGYTLLGDRLVVRGKDQWKAWSYPRGVVVFGEDGSVGPRYLRKPVNACLNAEDFSHDGQRGGIRAAGCREEQAKNLIDGDLDTYWEPDPKVPLSRWWVEIDLGRAVSATKIVLKFVEEGKGDPFYQFRVYTSAGEPAFKWSPILSYVLAGETKKPNTKQRVFQFELTPVQKADPSWTGRVVQYVRVQVTGSRLGRAEEVDEGTYMSLPPEERGDVEYIWKVAGEERPVTEAEYEKLPPEERGGVHYYRRELPRLAEVEVWAVGDNISLGLLERGGSLKVEGTSIPLRAFDGDYVSRWDAQIYKEWGQNPRWGLLIVDLGALFWVDTIRLITRREPERTNEGALYGYSIFGSDGSKAPDGTLIWHRLSPEGREILEERYFRLEDRFPPRKVRYLEFKHLDKAGRTAASTRGYAVFGRLGELQIFGRGYVPEVTLTSPLIELGGRRNLTSIRWDAETPEGTKVQIRTRTGDALREIKHYFNRNGEEITELEYNELPGFMRGEVRSEFVPGAGWSDWSQVYLEPGSRILSPSPRKYLMIEVRLLSDDPEVAPTLRSLEVSFRRPVVQKVLGEVYQEEGAELGRPHLFSLYISSSFGAGDPGFDEIKLCSPSESVQMHLTEVSLGTEEEVLSGSGRRFLPDELGRFVDGRGDTLKVLSSEGDTLWVRLPTVVRGRRPPLVVLRFRTEMYVNSSRFWAWVGNSALPGSWQQVDPGDATSLSPATGLTVFFKAQGSVLGRVDVEPAVLTPNGDGVGDEVRISFPVLLVNAPRTVRVSFWDTEGKEIRSFSERRGSAAGRYRVTWDGRDEGGRLVPPGTYLCRVEVGTDVRRVVKVVPITVIY